MAVLLQISSTTAMSITSEEREFFIALGERIARLRKEHGITQTQLAERLGVSQQTIQAYESGKRRIQVAAFPELARLLSTTLEELFGQQQETTVRKRGPAPKCSSNWKPSTNCPRASRNLLRRCSMS